VHSLATFQVSAGFHPEVFKQAEKKMKRKRFARLNNATAAIGFKLVPTQ